MTSQVLTMFAMLIFLLCLSLRTNQVDAVKTRPDLNVKPYLGGNTVSSRWEAHQERIGRTAEDDELSRIDTRILTSSSSSSSSLADTSSSMYSGFLAVGGENEGGALHYFFAESVDSPETAPLVLWLNGGPGASSFGGSILEQGPLIMNRTGTNLMPNPWAWTGEGGANMLFLESPPGVGFSYCAEQVEDPGTICAASDYTAAEANLDALRSFLMKFPHYLGRKFFITGESYAGVYVPTLSKLLYQSDLSETGALDFGGWAVGDPCTDNENQESEHHFSAAFALRHGIIDEVLYNGLTTCLDKPNSGICKDARAQYALAKENLFDEYNVYGVNGFTGYDEISTFLCDTNVLKALHVNSSPNAAPICTWQFETPLHYSKVNVGCADIPSPAGPGIINISDIYRELAGKLRIVLYNGDVDPAIDTIGSQRAAYAFGMPVKAGGEWRPWSYNETAAGESLLEWKMPSYGQSLSYNGNGEQLGGYVVDFEGDFTYLTFHGSGHMVPEYKPQAALAFFKKFIHDDAYAPPFEYPDDLDKALDDINKRKDDRSQIRSNIDEYYERTSNMSYEMALQKHYERISADMDDDFIDALPNVAPLRSRQYSGFLGLHGTNEGSAIHYWHVEAENVDPDDAPLVIWLTGGPGGSSLGAALTEHGPLILNRTGYNLIHNPYGWSGPANMLFLESPPGVGFSYCSEQLGDSSVICKASDDSAAEANLDALRAFLIRFPQYLGRDLLITGESYAGVYVPTLSKAVYESELVQEGKLNFLGWADGDPCTDDAMQMNQYEFSKDFALRRGVIDERLSYRLAVCLDSPSSLICKQAMYQYAVAKGEVLPEGGAMLFDTYNVYGVSDDVMGEPGLSQSHAYMNRDDVMDAFHVSDSPNAGRWHFSSPLDYTKTHLACNDFPKPGEKSIVDIYQYLAPKLRNIILYTGDVDPSVDQVGNQRAVRKMGFPVLDGGEWRPWFYNRTAAPMELIKWKYAGFGEQWSLPRSDLGEQLGGYVVSFKPNSTSAEHSFTYLTFHGSGHMVPEYKPKAALKMFETFINDGDYAPLLQLHE